MGLKRIAPTIKKTPQIHKGYDPSRSEGSVGIPVFLTSTFAFPSAEAGKEAFRKALAGENGGELIYSRLNHPGAEIAEDRMMELEPGAGAAACFCSGMSAITTTAIALLEPGQCFIYSDPVYGGTWEFANHFLQHKFHCPIDNFNSHSQAAAEKTIMDAGKNLGMVLIETPANPTLQMVDIDWIANVAKRANPNCYVAVDNTFMGIFQRPFEISEHVDLVFYSATKFLGGHSKLIAGVALVRKGKENLMPAIKGQRTVLGTILYPFESQQLLDTLPTYDLRMQQQAKNATKIAAFLAGHPKIKKVLHASLLKPGDLDYDTYKKQCLGPSSIISFYLKDADEAGAFRFLDLTAEDHDIILAVSLGGVDSLIEHPASMTHSEMTEEAQIKAGITPDFIRLSIGLEEPEDIINTLKKALDNY